jgi:hypothetical protein
MRKPIARPHTLLNDNGIQFTDLPKTRLGPRPGGASSICSTCFARPTASSIG